MKPTYFALALLCATISAFSQVLPPPPATQAEVNAGNQTHKYVSPATLAGSLLSTNSATEGDVVTWTAAAGAHWAAASGSAGSSSGGITNTVTALFGTNLLYYWPLNQNFGSNAFDYAGYNPMPMVLTNPVSGTIPAWQQGLRGGALFMGGTNSEAISGTNVNFANGAPALTVFAWVKLTNTLAANQVIFGQSIGGSGNSAIQVGVGVLTNVYAGGRSMAADTFQIVSSTQFTISTNVWTQVSAVFNYNSQYIQVYTNSVLCFSNSVSFGNSTYSGSLGGYSSIGNIGLPGAEPTTYFHGYISQVGVAYGNQSSLLPQLYNSGRGLQP